MKYQYIECGTGARIEPYYCNNWWCEDVCDCGLTFEEAKEILVSYYENRLEWANNLKEEE